MASTFAVVVLVASLMGFRSGAGVLAGTMPGPVRAFAENQPVTPTVDTVRDLFLPRPVSTDIWIALAWCLGLLVLAYALAMVVYRRRMG